MALIIYTRTHRAMLQTAYFMVRKRDVPRVAKAKRATMFKAWAVPPTTNLRIMRMWRYAHWSGS